MARRERRQRLALDLNTNLDEEPFSAQDQGNIQEQFSKLVEDIERIKAGATPSLDQVVLDEVNNAPGWVRVSRPGFSSPPTAPTHYYWHPATGQLSWTSPEGQDALKSMEMTRTIISDAVERLQNAAANTELQTEIPIAAQKAIQASALLNLLDSLSKEQHKSNPSEQMGIHASRVWCTVHACIAAAVAEIGAPAPASVAPLETQGALQTRVETEVVDGGKAIKEAAAAVVGGKSDDDMDIEEEKDEGNLGPDNGQKRATGQTASISKVPPSLAGVKLTKKTKIKPFSRVSGSRGASAMMTKWASVQKELKEDIQSDLCEDDFGDDVEALAAIREKKRLKQAEAWRTEQIRSGAVDGNPNFAPVMGDWRNKVKNTSVHEGEIEEENEEDGVNQGGNTTLQKEEQIPAPDPALLVAAATFDVDALSVGLPPEWRAIYDANTGGVYYGNIETQATQWERPR
ncbi:hypothetical protein Ndes2526B_g09569 [Nannochloris sp. 'desiccata']|nr:hypothetical protein NADE_007481 [Chlorella desiccata (nom. nud.)]KAH7615723.1 hypothetical protein NADE_007516 [Chlorella desiccata (nom. nud.)]